jgi:hypothetical protein
MLSSRLGKPALDDEAKGYYDSSHSYSALSSNHPSFSSAVSFQGPSEQSMEPLSRTSVVTSGVTSGNGLTSPGAYSPHSTDSLHHTYPPRGSPHTHTEPISTSASITLRDTSRPQPILSPPAIVLSPPEQAGGAAALIRAKHAAREEEFSRQAREQEERLLARSGSGSSYQSSAHPSSSSTTSPSSHLPPASPAGFASPIPGSTSSSDTAWREEVGRLREEMTRMQAVQQAVVLELGSVPPPEYSEDPSSTH